MFPSTMMSRSSQFQANSQIIMGPPGVRLAVQMVVLCAYGANARARRYAVRACGNDQENGCPDELPQEHSNSVRCIVPVNWFSPRDGVHAVDLLRLRGSPQATRRAGARENFPHHDL